MKYILAIDQGTTSTRAMLFDKNLNIVASSSKEFKQYFPKSGWVEHDPQEIYKTVIKTCKKVFEKANITAKEVVSIGITNQRETTIVWNKKTGKPIYNAIVWQDRRTAKYCKKLKKDGHERLIKEKTGLLLDSYFCSTKIAWILDHVKGARELAGENKLLFGTVDSYILYRLTGSKSHLTDATNASRTMLYNIKTNSWDKELCELFKVPMSMLPEVKDCAYEFGDTKKSIFGTSIPISAIAGDQQAAAIGQECFKKGNIKSTYGTGCFMLLNTGKDIIYSKNRLLTTIAYKLDGKTIYALEGSIFIAGSVVQWLRDGLKIIKKAHEVEELVNRANRHENIYFVPAFTGLGAPYWDSDCRGAIYNLTRNSTKEDIVKAALQSVVFQTKDLLDAMKKDWKIESKNLEFELRVDGGMSASDWTMQFLSDMLDTNVLRSKILETTALGVAKLAGWKSGFYPNIKNSKKTYKIDKKFISNMNKNERTKLFYGWKKSVAKTLR